MITEKRLSSLYLVLITIWWSWTILVDTVVVRTVFANVDNFFVAGNLGILLFSKLNSLEVIVASALVSLATYQVVKFNRSWKFLFVLVLLWCLAMTYFCYLTPKIIYLTDLWKTLDLMGINSTVEIPDVQQEHQFYHNLYIKLDGIKLILLTVLMGLGIWKEEK